MLAIAGAAASFVGATQAAGAESRSIINDHDEQSSALQERADELGAQASEDNAEAVRLAMIERARLHAANADRGSGNTTAAIMREAGFNEGLQVTAIDRNLQTNIRQNNREIAGTTSRANHKLASVKRPSLLATGLQIGGSIAEDPNVS